MNQEPTIYSPAVAAVLQESRLMELGTGAPNQLMLEQLRQLTVEAVLQDARHSDHDMARCCLAGLWLYHDFLDESHRISQDIDTACGSYWHGIMHRREGDFTNAKYWFNRVGEHPVFEMLRSEAARLAADAECRTVAQSPWNPGVFTDMCEASVKGNRATELLCRKIQQREWELLLDYCYRCAREHN